MLPPIPYPHLHYRVLKPHNLTEPKIRAAIQMQKSYPGYHQLVTAAGGLDKLAKTIRTAAGSVGGIPLVGAVVAAVLTVFAALAGFASFLLVSLAGLLVLAVNELTK